MSEDTSPSANGHTKPDESGSPDTCFVIAPLGDKPSETRKRTNGLLDEAIRPVVEHKLGLEVVAPHEIAEAGSITRQVIQRLLDAELVVADLTDLNPNVMYEMAVRHAKGRPVVPIAQEGTALPFDITTERTLFYEESFHGLNELKPKLEDAVRAALSDGEPDNPIYRAQQDFQMREAVAGDDAMEYLMDRIDEIRSAIESDGRATNRPASPDDTPPWAVKYEFKAEAEEMVDFMAELQARLPKGLDPEMEVLGPREWHVSVGAHPEDKEIVRENVESVADEVGLEFDSAPF